MKPYAFTAGAFGRNSRSHLFSCNMSVACETKWYLSWNSRANYSTWISQRLANGRKANSSQFSIPLDGGCPELHDCGSRQPGIRTARHGHRCLPQYESVHAGHVCSASATAESAVGGTVVTNG